jgi:RimJ/RimL family protein N-acetyltransferase
MRFWNRPVHPHRSATERVVRRATVFAPFKQLTWAVEDAESGQCIGMVNYHKVDLAHRHADIGYLLRRDRWGQGLAREAVSAVLGHCFAKLKLHRVQAIIDPDNTASRKLVEALGFTHEGTLRETLFLGDTWRDDCIYGLLERDWSARSST